jgi:hypothetical protein
LWGDYPLVLGVKDRNEFFECLAAEKAGALDADTIALIDQSITR